LHKKKDLSLLTRGKTKRRILLAERGVLLKSEEKLEQGEESTTGCCEEKRKAAAGEEGPPSTLANLWGGGWDVYWRKRLVGGK